MSELSPEETRRQLAILKPVRMEQHRELAYSGIAGRVLAMYNGGVTPVFDEATLLFVNKWPEPQFTEGTYKAIGEVDPIKADLLRYTAQIAGLQRDILDVGALRSFGPRKGYFGTEIRPAALRMTYTDDVERPCQILPLGNVSQDDADAIAGMIHQLELLKQTAGLTCLNEVLLNDAIDVDTPLPLP